MILLLSYETAKRLKEAGFPQPVPEVGQVWYNAIGYPFIIVRNMGGVFVCCSLRDGNLSNEIKGSDILSACSFVPTPTDILRELGFEFQGYFAAIVNEFVCLQDGAPGVKSWQHENPAEACAMAWLYINEKSETK
jgi:hypothetical protein